MRSPSSGEANSSGFYFRGIVCVVNTVDSRTKAFELRSRTGQRGTESLFVESIVNTVDLDGTAESVELE